MWWHVETPVIDYETVGLTLGLVFLFALGRFWCWACDVVDAHPDAFGFTDEPTADAERRLHSDAARPPERS